MEQHTDGNSILGWAIFAVSFIGSFLEPMTDVLKFIAALIAVVSGSIILYLKCKELNYKKRKRGGI